MTNADKVCDAITEFIARSTRPVLFAGAGVSTRAGLPAWREYLTGLAELLRRSDRHTRLLMLKCIETAQYARAAEYFSLSDGLTDGDKNCAITSPFLKYDASQIAPIAALPFSSYVTTNYDRVLFDAYAQHNGKAAEEVNLGDPTITAAPFQDQFYIARIHGRIEVPTSMVLTHTQYERLYRDTAYIEFLRHLFCSRSLMFVGFSFLDPAIQSVLRAVRDQLGAVHSGKHIALVDTDADAEFLAGLNRHNIRLVRYSPNNSHTALWNGLARFRSDRPDETRPANGAQSDAFAYARQYFAAALTRHKMSSYMQPLKQVVSEGMVLEMLREAGDGGLSREAITLRLSEQLGLNVTASTRLLASSLQGLATDSLYRADAAGILRIADVNVVQGSLRDSVGVLVEGAMQRLIVREHGSESAETREILGRYFEYLVLRRGWDIGAAYAARRSPQVIVVDELLGRLILERGSSSRPSRKLVRAIEGVLLSPSDAEANTLADLGRLAFALELVRQMPQDTLFSSQVLPTRIYLDANVLLPAIVEGHPYNVLYSGAMERLLAASAATSSGLEVCAYFGFLNEVVSHRRLACNDISSYGARAAEHIERDVRLYGSANMNVFVAGFARTLMGGAKISFDEYLHRFAPYATEAQLATWLRSRGLRVIEHKQMLVGAVEYPALLHHFEVMFSQEVAARIRTATLIAHDALQVAQLLGDMRRGDRAVFVSEDKRLRDAVAYSDFQNLGSAMLSGVGLVQMIDLLVGAIGDERSMANLLWSTQASSPAEKVRRYLVDIALTQYDAALAMNMESIVRELTEEITFAMERDSERAQRSDGGEISLGKYVEAFEPRFYELIRAEQEKQEELRSRR